MHTSVCRPVPNNPYGFCGRKAPRKNSVGIILGRGRESSVGKVERPTEKQSQAQNWYGFQSQLPVQTLLRCPCSPRMQSRHALTSVCTLQIPPKQAAAFGHTVKNTAHPHLKRVTLLLRPLCLTHFKRPEFLTRDKKMTTCMYCSL